MRKDRLLKLAEFLETVPVKAFDLSTWQASEATKPEGRRPGECGFSGCAVGWAIHTKMFRGFKMGRDGFGRPLPVYSGSENWDAVAALFEITTGEWGGGQAEYLFSDGEYVAANPTPKQVAKRIRAFVTSNGEVS